MTFLTRVLWPVGGGLVTAFVVMLGFEFVNSFFFPLPADLDVAHPEAVRAYTATLPWTAYVIVLVGWIAGSFMAGNITTRLSGEKSYRLSLSLGIILTMLGGVNNALIGHALWFNVIALPMFILFTYAGHRFAQGGHQS